MNIETGAYPFLTGLLGAFLGWLAAGKRIDKLEKDFEIHKGTVVYKDTCKECKEGTRALIDAKGHHHGS